MRIGFDLADAGGVEHIVTVGLQVITTANTAVGHNGAAATWLIGCGWFAVAITATCCAVKCVGCAKLMPDFMGYIVNVKRGSARGCQTSHASGFIGGIADDTNIG
jgi:hypothetical protein